MLQRCRPTSRTNVLTTRAVNAPATPSGSSCSRVEPCAIASATARARVHAARFTCADGAALLHDPLAATMLDSVAAPPVDEQPASVAPTAADVAEAVTARVLDSVALQGVHMCIARGGDEFATKQAVLLGPGLDTRAARVDWPRGTLVMELVPAAAAAATGRMTAPRHAQGSRALQRLYSLLPLAACDELHPEHTWVGQLLYSNDVELELQRLLTTNGFRGDRPSVWAMQGLRQLTHSQAEVLLMAAASLADTDSVLTGDLPACMTEEQAESLLASVGMQPSVMTVGAAAAALRVRQAEDTESDSAEESSAEESIDGHDDADRHLWRRLLFTATKRTPSQLQQEVYLAHVHRAMTEGEDGFDD